MTSSVHEVPRLKKSTLQIERQLGKLKAELEDLRDYVELLEARFQNQSKRRYTVEEARRKLQI